MIFVSYSRSDIAPTRILVESLEAKGISCWLDETNIPIGQAFVKRLGEALRGSDCFLLVDTPASRSSYWVSRELQTAFRYRREGRYHSILRVYSVNDACTNEVRWEASIPLIQSAPAQIAEFLAGRRTAQRVNSNREFGTLSFLYDSGLGQPSNWTGRQDELRVLDSWWLGSLPGAWLWGLGGIGKSGLLQTWVTALSYLGYDEPVLGSALYLRGGQFEVSEVQRVLLTWESRTAPTTRLLLLDGYDEARSTLEMEEILERAIHLGARVLATSRSSVPQSLERYFNILSVPTMTRRDSVAMLNQLGVSGVESEELATELGDHPLALLILMGSLARGGDQTPAKALEDLRRIQRDLSRNPERVSSVQTMLRHSLRGLTPDAKFQLEKLCRSTEDITELSVLAIPAIRELALAGLVQVDDLETPKQIEVHPLVRRYINEHPGMETDVQ